jgi:hydrogenase maturation protease
MARTLVIGYGNLDRQDDGAAFAVVNALRRGIGLGSLPEGDTGLEQIGGQTDAVYVLQLSPDLLDVAAGYERVVFVDAHVGLDVQDVHCTAVQPEYAAAAFTHHLTPAMFVALLKALYGREPAGFIVSVRGHRFDFARGLSAETQALVQPAAEQIRQLLEEPPGPLGAC